MRLRPRGGGRACRFSLHPERRARIRSRWTCRDESDGTRKLFALAGPIVDTLAGGGRFIIDEFDVRLHPTLSTELIRVFQDPRSNPHGAQLVVTTHQPLHRDPKLLEKDQIWFVDKDELGVSSLYSLAEFGPLPEGERWRDAYMHGRLGAIPALRNV